MSKHWDAIIVGGGPAGAAVSILLGRQGWRVLLVDAARFPRQKVCGEFLGSALWPLLADLGVDSLIRSRAVPIAALEMVLPQGARVRVPLEADPLPAIALSRLALDVLLLDAARQSGAELLVEHQVSEVVVEAGRAVGVRVVQVGHPERRQEFRASVVIAADGRRSVVVRDTGELRLRPSGLVGFKRHWHRSADRTAADAVLEMHARHRGYVGVCPVEEGDINVCGLMPASLVKRARGSIDAALAAWGLMGDQWSPQLLGAAPLGRWQTTSTVVGAAAVPRVTGALYVGDAAGTIEPVAGQGMTIALESAALAARLLIAAGPEGVDRTLQAAHRAACRQAFTRPMVASRGLGWLLRHPVVLRPLVPLLEPFPGVRTAIVRRAYRAMRIGACSAKN